MVLDVHGPVSPIGHDEQVGLADSLALGVGWQAAANDDGDIDYAPVAKDLALKGRTLAMLFEKNYGEVAFGARVVSFSTSATTIW